MFSAGLNARIIQLAPPFLVADVAPESFEDLARHAAVSGRITVYAGGSDRTIYGDPRVNWAFRAWHDSLHIRFGAGFSLADERRVGAEHARILGGTFGEALLVDVVKQREYTEQTGSFVQDQIAFFWQHVNIKKGRDSQ